MAMPFESLKSRYLSLEARVLAPLSDVERRDLRAFDRWFPRQRGWRWVVILFVATTIAAAGAAQLKWIKAAVGKRIKLIPVADVLYFQSDTKYTRVVIAQSEALIRTPLKELVHSLDPERFWQIHRGTVVNADAIAGVFREDAEEQFVMLKERPERLAVSRQFVHRFKQM